ncbi:MAG: carboxy-terminal processing peptidase [Stygiobacter sp.]|nr:MAG: carboxy-terminal processing peptidase [Stygiobacter sp.]KAF0215033.1 MAG: carboxy-terminal processing [Ignavibacteria bacterium]
MKTKKLFFLLVLLVFINKPILAQVNADVYTTYLFYTCKVWGYLKYFHSSLADGKINWDDVLLENLPKLKTINSDEEFNNYLTLYFNKLKTIPIPASSKPDVPQELRYNLNTNWFNNEHFSRTTISFLKDVDEKFRPRTNYYFQPAYTGGNLKFDYDSQYYNYTTTTNELRLLSLFRYWNIINYFFPYKNLLDKNWDEVLEELIPRINNVTDETDYQKSILELAAKLNDAHGFTSSTVINNNIKGRNYLPIKLQNVEGKLLIVKTAIGISGIKVGDIVNSINGISVEELSNELVPIISCSNNASFNRNLCSELISFVNNTPVKLGLETENKMPEVTLHLMDATEYSKFLFESTSAWSIVDKGNKKFGVVNMGVLTTAEVPTMFNDLWNTDAIIFDIRNYPKGTMWYMINYLFPQPILIARFASPDPLYPGTFFMKNVSVGMGDFSKNYEKNIYLLFNEETQSQAEYTIMALEQHPRAVKIGSQTAGADGNVSYIYLPGGITTLFTGLGVFYPDNSPTQRIGIVPDIEVKPTIKGIREGKDEVLEAAFSHYFNTTSTEEINTIPINYSIAQNYPNPFNPKTQIMYQIPKAEYVIIKVLDLLGRTVAVLEDQNKPAGEYKLEFNSSEYSLSSGVYFYNISAGNYSKTMKMILMK